MGLFSRFNKEVMAPDGIGGSVGDKKEEYDERFTIMAQEARDFFDIYGLIQD